MDLEKLLGEIFDSQYTTTYARNRVPGGTDYIGNVFFPDQNTNELSYKIVKAAAGLPVAANVHAFNTEAEMASRRGVEFQEGKIPGIKRKISLDEEWMVKLYRQGLGDLESVRNQIFNDLDDMVDSVYVRIEKNKMDAVANGKITLADDGIMADIDYKVPAEHKETLAGENLWSDLTNANPVENIQTWVNTVKDNVGVEVTRALTSNTVVAKILQNATVRQMILGDNYSKAVITLPQVNQLLASLGLPTIATYDARFQTESKADGSLTTQRFFPEEKFVLLPDGALGEGLLGPTPEALLDTNIQQSTGVSGIYAVVYKTGNDPVGIMTKAAATAIPTFPRADEIFQAKVL